LSREHLIERRRASGTRVIYQPPAKPMTADIANVLATLVEMGERTTSRLLSFGYVEAAGPVADALGVTADEKLQRSVRVRSTDGRPFSYLVAHVPERVGRTYTRRDLAGKPLLALLERSGVKIERAAQRVSAVLATPETARALKVGIGSPLIELVRVVYDRDRRGVEHLHALYRPDRYNLEMELERARQGGTWRPTARKPRTKPIQNTSKGKST
jgi:GntR family transcriptional regulator